ncbi:MAG TPA: lipase maturation factor family protein [Vicinamibacterales bacterium]|nr:lipase maturation factor family protein [Vicinamibacterales bacterium]
MSLRHAGGRTTYVTSTWLFLRLLGAVYLFAFWSLAQQVRGLVGEHGILPAGDYMAALVRWADASGMGIGRYWIAPTLCWIGTGDSFLVAQAVAGICLAVLLMLGLASPLVLPLLWLLYLSLAVVAGDFLAYQWDALLLESGLLAVVLAPPLWRHRLQDGYDPPPLARWLIWWLVFRLMFGSGWVKLASGDPTWRDLSAMVFHYETQPLPTPLAWYVFQLPGWFDRATTALVLAIELAVPWLVVCGRRPRCVAAAVLIALQASIASTGNYAFFNLLTAALCATLVDDRSIRRLVDTGAAARAGASVWYRWAPRAAAAVIGPVSAAIVAGQLGMGVPASLGSLVGAVEPLRSVNPYGLFAVMTTTRPEIVVEGSLDGVTWREYTFRHKPGDVSRRPTWVAPFQPRLDWQMWFAALSTYEREPWFARFLQALADGSPAVRALLARDPFEGRPPTFVRATLYRYRFTDWTTGRATGAWWTRERIGPYAPVMPRRMPRAM